MNANDTKNINPDYNDNSNHPIAETTLPEQYNLDNLNNKKNIDINKEESLSVKGNIDKEIEKSNQMLGNHNNKSVDETYALDEKLKYRKSNTNDSFSIDSETKLKNSPKKKTRFQEFIQGGYKKFSHAKNSRRLIQHYKFWEGNTYFPYGGHIIEGPCAFRPTMATGLALSLPTGLFIGFNAEYVTENWTIAILIILGVLCFLILLFLILSSFRDPGILRRHVYDGNYKYERNNSKVFQLGFIRHYKYCGTCSIIRPIRSSHCFDCNNCVEKCDHHCPWIGNCVGKRNYVFFFMFVVCLTLNLLCIEGFSIAHVWKYLHDKIDENNYKKEENKRNHIKAYSLCDVIVSLYLIIYGVICMCFTLSLLIYHLSLVINNVTTKEMLKSLWKNPFGNYFNRDIGYNVENTLNPEIKKYSILDILRNGKITYSERINFKNQDLQLMQQKFNNINQHLNLNNNNKNDQNKNIDPNEEINENDETNNQNFTNTNSYMDLDNTNNNNI